MKNSVLIVIVVVVSVVAGFTGGYISGSVSHASATLPKPMISSFSLSNSTIENSSLAFDTVSFNASYHGSADFQITVSNGTFHDTVTSGSFYKSINYTDLSLGEGLLLGGLNPGTYNVSLSVFSGNLVNASYKTLTVVPLVTATVTGPQSVNDSASAQKVVFQAHIIGGKGPYKYFWNISNDYYFGNVQNYTFSNNESSSFTVTFFTNPINSGSYGFDNSYFVTLTVEDSLRYSYSAQYPGYVVDVTG